MRDNEGMRFLIVTLWIGLLLRVEGQHGEAPSFEAAVEGTKRFQLAKELSLSVWAAEPQLSNGVAFSFDGRGRMFVAETHRYGVSVFDITKNSAWLLADMALRSVDDRARFLARQFVTNQSLLTRDREQVRMLEDRDGDGRADHSKLVLDTPSTSVDGTAAGILATGNQLYFGSIPSLWNVDLPTLSELDSPVPQSRVLRPAVSLHSGFGVHIGVTGHDLHGLIRGPDGRIYMSFGDRGVCLTNREGVVINLPDRGGVLRCGPEGQQLEVFCSGLRNPQELAFDDLGDLWTSDNDTAGPDDCRVLHLVEGGEYGWRTSYQHMDGFGPWVSELLWKGGKDGILPPAGQVSQGPSGLAFYPGTGWGKRLAGRFVHCDFPGGVWSFSVTASGASYAVSAKEKLLWNCWPTDVDFGPDGALYVMDWIQGWEMPQRGRIYRMTPTDAEASSPQRLEEMRAVRSLLAEGMTLRTEAILKRLLGHADRRVRLEAQWELASRGARSVNGLVAVARLGKGRMERLHALWALGQLARGEAHSTVLAGVESLRGLIESNDSEVAIAAMVLLTEAGVRGIEPRLIAQWRTVDLRRRAAAFSALAKVRSVKRDPTERADSPFPSAAFRTAFLGSGLDPFLRLAAVRCLANEVSPRKGQQSALEWVLEDPDEGVRGLGIEVLRRASDGAVAAPLATTRAYRIENQLGSSLPLAIEAASRAIHDVPMVEGLPELARLILRVDCPPALMSRSINACLRLGTSQHAQMLGGFAKRRDVPSFARKAALKALGDWSQPPALDAVVGLWRPVYGGFEGFKTSNDSSQEDSKIREVGEKIGLVAKGNSLMIAAQKAMSSGRTTVMQFPYLSEDLGRSISFEAAGAFKRNAEPAKRAFLKVAGEILNPQTSDLSGLELGGSGVPVEVQLAVIATVVQLRTKEASSPLYAHFEAPSTSVAVKRAIVDALVILNAAHASEAVRIALETPTLWVAAVRHLDRLESVGRVLVLSNLVEQVGSVDGVRVAQAALGVLGETGEEAVQALSRFVRQLKAGQFPKVLALDLGEAVRKTTVSNLLATSRSKSSSTGVSGYEDCLSGGDAEKGRRIFRENQAVQCLRCHRVGGEGGNVGPRLDGEGPRSTREQHLESLVWPDLKTSVGYETVALTLRNGTIVAGGVRSQSNRVWVVETVSEDGLQEVRQIPFAEVVKREQGRSAMPEGLVEQLSLFELRDLIEYLAGLR
ncbi:MAG: hypothetical protein EXS25_06960 [Pedosphaera sp.]|nr:hypothetical protein [Pedosphaera sp.]